jgi:hypothetical protein
VAIPIVMKSFVLITLFAASAESASSSLPTSTPLSRRSCSAVSYSGLAVCPDGLYWLEAATPAGTELWRYEWRSKQRVRVWATAYAATALSACGRQM